MTGSDTETSTSTTGVDLVLDGLRGLGDVRSLASVMQLITDAAVAGLADVAAAGLTLLTGDRFTTKAPTSALPITVDALQYEYGGPCLDALLNDDDMIMHVDDLRTEQRWPGFAAAALAQTPVLSMLSYCLYLNRDDRIGSLNLYATKPHAFGSSAVRAGERLADYSAVVLSSAIAQDEAGHLEPGSTAADKSALSSPS